MFNGLCICIHVLGIYGVLGLVLRKKRCVFLGINLGVEFL